MPQPKLSLIAGAALALIATGAHAQAPQQPIPQTFAIPASTVNDIMDLLNHEPAVKLRQALVDAVQPQISAAQQPPAAAKPAPQSPTPAAPAAGAGDTGTTPAQ